MRRISSLTTCQVGEEHFIELLGQAFTEPGFAIIDSSNIDASAAITATVTETPTAW